MVRWREVISLNIKALTSYSATLFDLKNKKCLLREGAKNILWWGCITSYPKVRWGHLQPKALRFCPPPHPMGMFLTPSLTRPLHTVPTVESLHISYRTELPKILHVRISVTSLKKWGLHLLA